MNSKIKWTLLSLTIPALIACGGSGSSDSPKDNTKPSVIEPKPTLFAVTNQGENAKVNSRVRLDGSSSYSFEGRVLTYNWVISTKPDGSNAALSKADAISPTFDPDVAGTYIVDLTVSNGSKTSKATSVTFNVSTDAVNTAPNVFPVTNVNAVTDTAINLSANAKDADARDQLSYAWSVLKQPEGATPTLTNETSESTAFTGNVIGEYQVQVAVSDGTDTVSKTITVNVNDGNVAPIAKAFAFTTPVENTSEPVNRSNAATFELGGEATLDASQSYDANTTDIHTYQWSVVSKPSDSKTALSDNTAEKPTFTPDVIGEYTFSLTVNDGEENSEKAFVRVSATETDSSQIKLFDKDGNELTWPQKPTDMITKSLNGTTPDFVEVSSYRLEAINADFKIIESSTMELDAQDPSAIAFTPRIEGLETGTVVRAGDVIEVSLQAKPTNGAMKMLVFSFAFSLNPEILVSTGHTFITN
ncbi:PKD domain-containing protein [Vibrio penaeicida]|uniref:PKD domain-containing protein n=1 Tax=Vibrio penaeicida TaxID=104609 RepID=UPI000CEA2CA7|nr:hypothetical protein [Vibrio penaeicida]